MRHIGEGLRVRLVFQHRIFVAGEGAAEASELMSMARELMIVASLLQG
jgi:hypothetical protein